ncbi:MAG: hypothetical protein Q9184_005197 [Pyrenodesmia sp. 2 TL-2023]
MRAHFALAIPLALTSFATTTLAYNDCKGSSLFPNKRDCFVGLRTIDVAAKYIDQDEFSAGHCMIKYRTDGSGPQEVSGQVIRDTAKKIMKACNGGHGSLDTGNCATCHVTMNYRYGGQATTGAPHRKPGDWAEIDQAVDGPPKE